MFLRESMDDRPVGLHVYKIDLGYFNLAVQKNHLFVEQYDLVRDNRIVPMIEKLYFLY